MFAIVLALGECGFTSLLSSLLIKNNKSDAITFTLLSALSSNLLNNIPMSVLFEKIVSSSSVFALYGSIIGSDIGAFITPVGALAGIMWGRILSDFDTKLTFLKFSVYGIIVALFCLPLAFLGLLIV